VRLGHLAVVERLVERGLVDPRVAGDLAHERPEAAASFTISPALSYPMYGFSAAAAESVSSA
jgi:hypothetical protein